MAIRFRRRFKLAPGLYFNVSGGGASLSVGPRGFSTTFGKRGTFLNTNIPGTGLYSRTRVDGGSSLAKRAVPAAHAAAPAPDVATLQATIRVNDDGSVEFLDEAGNALPAAWVDLAKRQRGDEIRQLLQKRCAEMNAKVEALGTIHLHTPAPHERLRFEPREFPPAPVMPDLKPYGLLAKLFKPLRKRIDSENASRMGNYEEDLREWNLAKAEFDKEEEARRLLLEERVFTDVEAMEDILEGALKAIEWPRETSVSAEVDDDGRLVLVDVDLPEIEDLPRKLASVPQRGYRMTVKEMSATKVQKLYMEHVHGIGFRIIGETFAVLPKSDEVVLSAFSQRPDKGTGEIQDHYLYSVRVKREQWSKINFSQLESVDVVTALERFQLRRNMTKSGLFKPIEPLLGTTAVPPVKSPSVG